MLLASRLPDYLQSECLHFATYLATLRDASDTLAELKSNIAQHTFFERDLL